MLTTITLDGIKYVREDSINQPAQVSDTYAIFRTRNAGVHAGELVSRENGVVRIANSRRLWKWRSKATLSELSQEGPIGSDNKFGCVVPLLDLTESDVCEVIYCTDIAKQKIAQVDIWVA